jgi:hypothetical protein
MSSIFLDLTDHYGARPAPAQVRVAAPFTSRTWAHGAPTITGARRQARTFCGPHAAEAARAFVLVLNHQHAGSYPITTTDRGTVWVDLTRWPEGLGMADYVWDVLDAFCHVVE